MKASVQVVPVERAVYVRLEAETAPEHLLLSRMEYWTPTWDRNREGQLECRFDDSRKGE